jgi:hypothetical protein
MNSSYPKSSHRNPLAEPKPANRIRITLGLLCAGLALLTTGCGVGTSITGSGTLVSKSYGFSGFSHVDVSNAFQVQITQAPQHSVAVTVDDNLIDYLDVTQSGDTLRIGLQRNVNLRKGTLNAEISMPSLTKLNISGAVRTTIAGFRSEGPFDAGLSGASNLRGDITNGDARFEISGASRLELQGSAADLEVSASGASEAQLREYASSNASVEVSGASNATVQTSGKLDANASGASSIRYVGQPQSVSPHTSGASSVKPEL